MDYPFSKNRIGVGINGFKDQNGATGFAGFESTFAYHISGGKKGKDPLTGFPLDYQQLITNIVLIIQISNQKNQMI